MKAVKNKALQQSLSILNFRKARKVTYLKIFLNSVLCCIGNFIRPFLYLSLSIFYST